MEHRWNEGLSKELAQDVSAGKARLISSAEDIRQTRRLTFEFTDGPACATLADHVKNADQSQR
jgi:hypothetical protein